MLLDTGPIVAALLAGDQWGARVIPHWPDLVERCITTEAVLTEATHLMGRRGGDSAAPLEFLLGSRVPVIGLTVDHHRACALLMRRYAEVPMDYADATLVTVSDATGIVRVFTTDRRGFRVYRGARGAPFEIVS